MEPQVEDPGQQVGEMDLWIPLPGVTRSVVGFLCSYYRNLWPEGIQKQEEVGDFIHLFFSCDQEMEQLVTRLGVTSRTAPYIGYLVVILGAGVEIAYTSCSPEEEIRAQEIRNNLLANRSLF